jgi:hypothetical protein
LSERSPFEEDDLPAIRNAANAKSNRKVQDEEARARKQRDAIVRAVLAGPVGRRLMYSMIEDSGGLRDWYGRGTDQITRFMALGQQQYGWGLFLSLLRVDDEAVLKMLRENHPALVEKKKDGEKPQIEDYFRDLPE